MNMPEALKHSTMSRARYKARRSLYISERMRNARTRLIQAGAMIIAETDLSITILVHSFPVTYYPYTGRATGKSITDARYGIDNFIKAIAK